MTEIKIEKKKLVWPWVLLGVALIAVLIYFLGFYDYNEEINEEPKTSEIVDVKGNDQTAANANEQIADKDNEFISVNENNSTVETYVNFVEENLNKMGMHHVYTNDALLKLIDATNAVADEVGYDVQADLAKAKEYARMITVDQYETTHADNIRKATDMLAKVLQNIQKAKYQGLSNETAELKKASEAINPKVLTLDQRNEVKTFFIKAAELLKKMN